MSYLAFQIDVLNSWANFLWCPVFVYPKGCWRWALLCHSVLIRCDSGECGRVRKRDERGVGTIVSIYMCKLCCCVTKYQYGYGYSSVEVSKWDRGVCFYEHGTLVRHWPTNWHKYLPPTISFWNIKLSARILLLVLRRSSAPSQCLP